MFTNKSADGNNNICGKQIETFRKGLHISQKALADALQIEGLDIDKNAIQRIEAGKRFVTDIELPYFAKVLNVTYQQLLNQED